ncbi:MAG: hypothetical protein HYY17_09555 [Planctomycetes bacterium]|nr:hypothetical protein [Planctomycetota bacterium]
MGLILAVAVLSAADEKDFFPVKAGAKWTYAAGEEEVTVTVEGPAKVGEKECHVFKREWKGGSSKEFFSVTDQGVFLVRLEADRNTEFPDNPVPRMKFGTKKGETWTWKFEQQEGTYENQGEEEIEVPAGKFKAWKIHVVAQAGEMKYVTTRWFAAGVGLVREEMKRGDQTRITELKKFELPK